MLFLYSWHHLIQSSCLDKKTLNNWTANKTKLANSSHLGWEKAINRFREKPTSEKRLRAIYEWSPPIRTRLPMTYHLSMGHVASSIQGSYPKADCSHILCCSAAQKQAYEYPFQGDAATRFLQYILDASKRLDQLHAGKNKNEPVEFYAQSVSIVQSSGTGKSRMMSEVRVPAEQ